MSFDYDLARLTGRPDQVLPVLRQQLREAGFDVHPAQDEILLRHEVPGVGRVQARLACVPKGASVLRFEVPVTSVPSPPPDAFYVSLLRWNAGVSLLRAHTLEKDDQVRVVLRASLIPQADAREPFSIDEIRALLDQMTRAKPSVSAAISG